jgi:hypothetical protein
MTTEIKKPEYTKVQLNEHDWLIIGNIRPSYFLGLSGWNRILVSALNRINFDSPSLTPVSLPDVIKKHSLKEKVKGLLPGLPRLRRQ